MLFFILRLSNDKIPNNFLQHNKRYVAFFIKAIREVKLCNTEKTKNAKISYF